MQPELVFQKFVQRDMDDILRYYADEAGEIVADRFFQTFLMVVDHALFNPGHHRVSACLRRADVPGFPYLFLYREVKTSLM